MQLVHCTVNLNGDPRKQVRRVNVSVPEIMILQAIHGDDAVIEMEYAGERDSTDEKERLDKFYGGKQEILDKIKELFPGARPQFPQKLTDIGIDIASPEAIAAYEEKKAKIDQVEAEDARKRAAARRRTEKLEALTEVALADEAELLRPPKMSKKRADPLMA